MQNYKLKNDKYIDNKFKVIADDLLESYKKLEALRLSLKSILSVGADIVPYERQNEHSWAVVCIEGNINIVKFINLDRKNTMDILQYLKQFEGGRMVVDTPNYPLFYDTLVFNRDFRQSNTDK